MANRALIVPLGLLACLVLSGGCASAGKRTPAAATYTTEQLLDIGRQADAAYREDRLVEAERLYGELLRAVPEEAPYWYRLGNVYARADRSDEAILAYQRVLRLDARHARAWHNLAVVRLRQAEAAFSESAHVAIAGDGAYEESRRMVAVLQAAEPQGVVSTTPASIAQVPAAASVALVPSTAPEPGIPAATVAAPKAGD